MAAHLWKEFPQETGETGEELVQYKKDIVAKYGDEGIKKSWIEVCALLEKVTKVIAEKKTSMIPDIKFSEFADLSEERVQKLKEVGCLVVRDVIDREEAEGWFMDLKRYIADNKNDVTGKTRSHRTLITSSHKCS